MGLIMWSVERAVQKQPKPKHPVRRVKKGHRVRFNNRDFFLDQTYPSYVGWNVQVQSATWKPGTLTVNILDFDGLRVCKAFAEF